MEGKKSFLLYTDINSTLQALTDEQAGKLFKLILSYVNDEDPEPEDQLLKIAFAPIKEHLKRDLKKWEQIQHKRSIAGQKSAEARKKKKKEEGQQPLTSVKSVQQSSTNSTVNDNDNDNDNVNVSVSDNVKPKKTIEDKLQELERRKLKFSATLKPFLNVYGQKMLLEFFEYWTEPNRSATKLRHELEKTWDLERRLKTWAARSNSFKQFQTTGPTKKQGAGIDADYLEEIKQRLNGNNGK